MRSFATVELILFIALVLVSVGLIAAILLQSRGSGLGATFGGESSVYRSRRGVEDGCTSSRSCWPSSSSSSACIVYLDVAS